MKLSAPISARACADKSVAGWLLSAALCTGLVGACGSRSATGSDTPPPPVRTPQLWQPPADLDSPVAARFAVRLAPAAFFDERVQLQPTAEPVTVTLIPGDGAEDGAKIGAEANDASAPFSLSVFAHRDQRFDIADKGRIWLELYLVNQGTHALRDAVATIKNLRGVDYFYDHSRSPYAGRADDARVFIGGVGREGVGHVSIAVPDSGEEVTFDVHFSAHATRYQAVSSQPIAVTPDGGEVWAVGHDANVVAVIDTSIDSAQGQPVAQIPASGRPVAVALTPDGTLALAVSADSNEVRVIERASRKVVQTLGEADGIGREPRHIVISPDGARAYVSSYVGDSITALARYSNNHYRVVGRAAVGRRPVGMSLTADGGHLIVSHFLPRHTVTNNEGWVSVVATKDMSLVREVGIADDANDANGNVCIGQRLGVPKDQVTGMSGDSVPTQLAGAFLLPNGSEAWVPGMRLLGVPIWEGDLRKGGFGPNPIATSSITFVLDTRRPDDTIEMPLPAVADLDHTSEEFLRCFKPRVEFKASSRVKLPNGQQISPVVAIPSGYIGLTETAPVSSIGFTRGGRRALMLSRYADEVMVYDAMTRHPTSQRYFVLQGSTPNGIAITPDGKKGYVAYENELFVSVLDLSAYAGTELPGPTHVPYTYGAKRMMSNALNDRVLIRFLENIPDRPPIREIGQILLADDPLDPLMRHGKRLFYSANPERFPQQSASRKAGCAICHPDGGHDGAMWGTMEGERRTMSLRGGVAGRGWLHQSATHHDARSFSELVVIERLQGKGATDRDIDALAKYIAHGIPRLQPPKTDPALVARGKDVFAEHCASCHAGPHYTSGNADPASPWGGGHPSGPELYDVGSATDWAGVVLGEGLLFILPPQLSAVGDRLRMARGDRDLGPGDPLQAEFGFRQRIARERGQLKAPPLVNVWDYVLFFHDGRTSDLGEAVTDISERVGVDLSTEDHKAVVEYLKTL